MRLPTRLNIEQKKNFASFFNSLAVAWVVAVFIDANSKHDLLTIMFDLGNMVISISISSFLLKGKLNDNNNQ